MSKINTVKAGSNSSKLKENQVFIHNKSGATFHLPLLDEDPKKGERAISFELNEVQKFDKSVLETERFEMCFEGGFLEVFDDAQYAAFLKEQEREKSKSARQQVVGNHSSGLPLNRQMAITQIGMMDDADYLEALLRAEQENPSGRSSVIAALEDRMEELQEGNYID